MESRGDHSQPEPARSVRPIEIGMSATALFQTHFRGATAGRLALAARRLADQLLDQPERTVGLSLDAPMTVTGLAVTALVPLLRHGYIDWLAVTGTNLYYDALLALRKPVLASVPEGSEFQSAARHISAADREATESTLREFLAGPDLQKTMGSAELHDRIGRELRQREKDLGVEYPGLLSTAHELGIPIINPSPAEGPFGSIIAQLAQVGNRLSIDASLDLNLSAGILNAAASTSERSSCAFWCLGAGVGANLMLGSPAHLQRILGRKERGHRPFSLRMAGHAHMHPAGGTEPINPDALWPTDPTAAGSTNRPAADQGPASGNPDLPQQAHSGALMPQTEDLALATDLSMALPLMTAFLLDRVPPRPLKRLGQRRDDLLDGLRQVQLSSTLRRPTL